MSTYKFKTGRGAHAKVIFEGADEAIFAAKVRGELAHAAAGLVQSSVTGRDPD